MAGPVPPEAPSTLGPDSVRETESSSFGAELIVDGLRTVVKFDDLCSPCGRAVKSALLSIGKKIEGLSPDRKPRTAKAPVEKKPEKKPHQKG